MQKGNIQFSFIGRKTGRIYLCTSVGNIGKIQIRNIIDSFIPVYFIWQPACNANYKILLQIQIY